LIELLMSAVPLAHELIALRSASPYLVGAFEGG